MLMCGLKQYFRVKLSIVLFGSRIDMLVALKGIPYIFPFGAKTHPHHFATPLTPAFSANIELTTSISMNCAALNDDEYIFALANIVPPVYASDEDATGATRVAILRDVSIFSTDDAPLGIKYTLLSTPSTPPVYLFAGALIVVAVPKFVSITSMLEALKGAQ